MANLRVMLLCCALGITHPAWAAQPSVQELRARRQPTVRSAPPAPESLPVPSDPPTDESSAAEEVATNVADEAPGESWRYRCHLGRWWYFVEPGHWLFWDGRCWQDALPMVPKQMPDGSICRVGPTRRVLAAWPQVPSYREHHGWVGGFYSSGGGYGSTDFGYGYGIPNYGPARSR